MTGLRYQPLPPSGSAGDNSDNSHHVVTGSGADASAVLDDFTISGGNADGSFVCAYGSGMYHYEGSPTLHNCILWGNRAPNGPEIYNASGSSPTISYSLVEGSGGSDNWVANLGSDGGYNIDADPLFVDAASGDLHLRPESPAVDTETTTMSLGRRTWTATPAKAMAGWIWAPTSTS